MHGVVSRDITSPIAVEPGYEFLGQIEMIVHHRSHLSLRPVLGISAAQKISN